MIYSKSFTDEDLEFFVKNFDVSETFFSFIGEEFEPRIVEVAKKLDPSLMVLASIIPSISKENFLTGIEALTEESGEAVAMLESSYRGFDFGREDLHDDETLKAFVRAHPLSAVASRVLSLGKFDDDFIIERAHQYAHIFKKQRIAQGVVGLLRISFNMHLSEEGRERFFHILQDLDTDMEAMIFNSAIADEEEFMEFYVRTPQHLLHESLTSSACPNRIRDKFLEPFTNWQSVEKLALAGNLTESQCERYASLISEALESEPANPDELKAFLETVSNFVNNQTVPLKFLRQIAEHRLMILKKELHGSLLTAIASRIHEDESMYQIAQEIINSYDLSPNEAADTLMGMDGSHGETKIPSEMMLYVNNVIAFFYSILRNVRASAEVLATVTVQSSVANEAISLTMLPHPNLGDVQAAEILDNTVGTPFEQITLLHIRNAEVMRMIEHRYYELSTKSKLAVILNPQVHGETYLALALQEEDLVMRELLMRAGGEAYINSQIGGLFLTSLSTNSKIEAWKGSVANPSLTTTRYAAFNVNA